MTAPKLIVFDVDGTLLDSQTTIISAMGLAFEAVDRAPPEDAAVLSIVGLSLPEAMRSLSRQSNDQEIETLVQAYRDGFVRQRAQGNGEASVSLYEGARDCLNRLSKVPHYVLGTATGKARRGLDAVIKGHGLQGMFTNLQTADLHPSKPDPSMLQAASQETGIPPGSAVMVGDTSYDMEMGKAAGFATIGVEWGYHPTRRLEKHADVLVSDFGQIDEAIVQLVERS